MQIALSKGNFRVKYAHKMKTLGTINLKQKKNHQFDYSLVRAAGCSECESKEKYLNCSAVLEVVFNNYTILKIAFQSSHIELENDRHFCCVFIQLCQLFCWHFAFVCSSKVHFGVIINITNRNAVEQIRAYNSRMMWNEEKKNVWIKNSSAKNFFPPLESF